MRRREALEIIDEVFRDRPLVMTCGAPARELASIARRDSHLYLLDSMGLAAAVGAGLALADARAAVGPSGVIARIKGGNDPDVPLLLEDPVTIGDRFRGFLSTQEG